PISLRVALPISLGRHRSRSACRHRVDVVLQSRMPKYGPGRHHPQTAVGHGRIALLLLSTVKNGGITQLGAHTLTLDNTADELQVVFLEGLDANGDGTVDFGDAAETVVLVFNGVVGATDTGA